MDRYIAWPAQALSYQLGKMKILELGGNRAWYQRTISIFVLSTHGCVDESALPLDLLKSIFGVKFSGRGKEIKQTTLIQPSVTVVIPLMSGRKWLLFLIDRRKAKSERGSYGSRGWILDRIAAVSISRACPAEAPNQMLLLCWERRHSR